MITLTEEQIDAGRAAAMKRDKKWRPTPPEAVALAHRLFKALGRLRSEVECVEVAIVAGASTSGIWNRLLMGELGLPTPNVERALAFADGQTTYTRVDGSVRQISDDRDYQNDRDKWVVERWWSHAAKVFRGLSQDFVDGLWVDHCPCCGVAFRTAGAKTSPTLDHLVPGVHVRDNARLICSGCNVVKQDALPWMLHRVADWMTLTPAAMIERARSLPEMPRRKLNGCDRRKDMLSGKRWNAKEYGVEFTLTLEDVAWTASCPVFGVDFLLQGSEASRARNGAKGAPRWDSPNFDRIDPRLGYVKGNVVLVCSLANNIMQDATSPDRVRQVATWFDAELEAAPALAALIDGNDHRAHWAMAAE